MTTFVHPNIVRVYGSVDKGNYMITVISESHNFTYKCIIYINSDNSYFWLLHCIHK